MRSNYQFFDIQKYRGTVTRTALDILIYTIKLFYWIVGALIAVQRSTT